MYTFLPEPTIQLSVEVNELVSNNVSKDRPFQRYLILDILTKPRQSYTPKIKKGNILGKNPLPISLFSTYYSVLKIKFVPFPKSQPATIPCKIKTIKWVTKAPIKKEKKEKKRAREKDRNRFAKNKNKNESKFWRLRMRGKQKAV